MYLARNIRFRNEELYKELNVEVDQKLFDEMDYLIETLPSKFSSNDVAHLIRKSLEIKSARIPDMQAQALGSMIFEYAENLKKTLGREEEKQENKKSKGR